MLFNVDWFKREKSQLFTKFILAYRYFPNGDFGHLDEVTFENKFLTGAIQFWEQGYLGIQLFDYSKNETLINILLQPDESLMKKDELNNLFTIINNY